VNPSTALARVLVDELRRCGLRDIVLAPGSRSAPLAMAAHAASAGPGESGGLRLHVRIDERSAAFLALGLSRAGGRPTVVLCTSGTAAAHFHAAVIEADEAAVPLLVLTADRPPELRGTGASQVIDQLRLYGPAVRWFCEVGVPEAGPDGAARPGQARYWRSMAGKAWALAAGTAGGPPGPVHLNLAFREPLVPDDASPDGSGPDGSGEREPGPAGLDSGGADSRGLVSGGRGSRGWDLGARAGRDPWTRFAGPVLELPWTERGVIVAGNGVRDPAALIALADAAGWPLLAEPSSGARGGPVALSAYPYLLESAEFLAAHRPDVIVSAGRPGLSRSQLALLRGQDGAPPARHVVLAGAPGRWADPARTATDVTAAIVLTGAPTEGGTTAGDNSKGRGDAGQAAAPAADNSKRRAGTAGRGAGTAGWAASPVSDNSKRQWLRAWQAADGAARAAVDAVLDDGGLSEPRLARDVAALLPDGALVWAASSLPVRDLDQQMGVRAGLRVLANRGASGIDGLVSAAIGAALAHQAGGGGPAVALLGDLALLHDSPGLMLGPDEARPDLCLLVVNNDGGGIFSQLEQAAFPESFERVFGTPHGADVAALAAAAGLPYTRVTEPDGLAAALARPGLHVAEVRTSRAAGTALRRELSRAAGAAVRDAVISPLAG
jgi:2-succinyl-5-enolpyruvyl-6-hydroxy-3-cyclohexene-1-carboxylate synthase